jgi:hypothetical protein
MNVAAGRFRCSHLGTNTEAVHPENTAIVLRGSHTAFVMRAACWIPFWGSKLALRPF